MIKEKKSTPPKRNVLTEEERIQRSKDIEDAIKMKVNECGEFTTSNINAWKSLFFAAIKDSGKKYTMKKKSNNTYSIWRIA